MSRYLPRLVVRNPRNLERMGYQRTPTGHQFEKNREHRSFIYRCVSIRSAAGGFGGLRAHFGKLILIVFIINPFILWSCYGNVAKQRELWPIYLAIMYESRFFRAELESTHKMTIGQIRHYQDGIIVSASTREWPIAKQLYRYITIYTCF